MTKPRPWLGKTTFPKYLQTSFMKIVSALGVKLDFRVLLVGFEVIDPTNYNTVEIAPKSDQNVLPVEEIEQIFEKLRKEYIAPPEVDLSEADWQKGLARHIDYCTRIFVELVDVLRLGVRGYIPFCSTPRLVDQHLVSIVLLISRQDYETQPHLSEDVWYKYGQLPSLMYAIAGVFLRVYSLEMSKVESIHHSLSAENDPRELIRTAGQAFFKVTSNADRVSKVEDILTVDLNERFEACNVISAMNYERDESIGDLVLSKRAKPAIETEIEFETATLITEHRKVRKMLAMCTDKLRLLSNQSRIYGLGIVNWDKYKSKDEDFFVVKFVKHHCWELVHYDKVGDAEQVLMRVEYNQPKLPLPKFNCDDLEWALKERLNGISEVQVKGIVALGREASNASHGAMLVVSDEAACEASRLQFNCFKVVCFRMTEGHILATAAIDGATLLDRDGKCHALGVILDGRASDDATSARGARYNSAIRYSQEHRRCVVIVVSEDGMVDVIPKRPKGAPDSVAEPAALD